MATSVSALGAAGEEKTIELKDGGKIVLRKDGKTLHTDAAGKRVRMPIKARIDMLSTGIRTPIGIKVFGKDLDEIERLAKEIEAVVKQVPGTTSAFAERITGGFYLNIEPDRAALARYGLAVGELQEVIATALGGETVTTTVEGRERFGVNVRYPRELRSDPDKIARSVLVPTMEGAMIPLGQLARVEVGPRRILAPMQRSSMASSMRAATPDGSPRSTSTCGRTGASRIRMNAITPSAS